jgi:hypothetical protein
MVLTGKAPSPLGEIKDTLSGKTSLSSEALYSDLSASVSDPDRDSSIDGKLTFTCYVYGEPFEEEFEEEPGVKHIFQEAYIARNDDYFLLNVKDLKESLKPDSYYTITGKLNGTVYWTEDSEKVTALDVLATDAKPFTPKKDKANTGSSVTADGNTYKFLGAHKSEYQLGDCVVVYFDFKNNGSNEAAPRISDFPIYQGSAEERSNTLIFDPDEADSKALNATEAGIPDKTYAGKTQRYFAVFKWEDVKEDSNTLYLVRYNDDFELTDDISIPIAKSYKAWQAK